MSNNLLNIPTQEDFNTRFNQIRNAIASFGGFALLPGGTVSVTNGVFTVPYTGSTTLTAASIEICDCPIGISQSGLSYTVSYANGTATFTLIGNNADGVYTSALNCLIQIGDTAYAVNISGLPVKYEPTIVAPMVMAQPLSESAHDATEDIEFDLSDLRAHNLIAPYNVSPAPAYEGYGIMGVWNANEVVESQSVGVFENVLSIPANSLPQSSSNACHLYLETQSGMTGFILEVITQ